MRPRRIYIGMQADFFEQAAPLRAELIAHCYRMVGSVHDAEDLVQETYLRGWRAYGDFQARSSLRTWMYRIATHACLRALEGGARRVLPSGLGAPVSDHHVSLESATDQLWLQPFPTSLLPDESTTARESVRLAIAVALQHLPPRQRGALLLRDVAGFSAAETARMLGTTTAAVNSAHQRARARLDEIAPRRDDATEPDQKRLRSLLDRYAAAFEAADMAALAQVLTEDVTLDMPPFAEWFRGRHTVTAFFGNRIGLAPGEVSLREVGLNGQPGFSVLRRDADGVKRLHAVQVLGCRDGRIAEITVFLDPPLFAHVQ